MEDVYEDDFYISFDLEEDFYKVNLDLRVGEFAVSVVKDGVQRAVPTWWALLVIIIGDH